MAKKKDAPPASISGSADASAVRRSITKKQATVSPWNTRKSVRLEKQITPNPSPSPSPVKKKPEINEKETGPSPLRRSDRGKNPVDVPASNLKTAEEKTGSISKESTEDVNEVNNNNGSQDLSVGVRKRKRLTSVRFKALFKPQRIRVESDGEEYLEGQDDSSQANTSSHGDVDMELEGRDVDAGKCGYEVEDKSVEGESDCRTRIAFTEGPKVSLNSRRVQGSPDKVQKAILEEKLINLEQDDVGFPSQIKPLDGKCIESGNMEKQIDSSCSPSNRNIGNSDTHISRSSSSRINHDLENQQELDSCDKVTGTCISVGLMENADNHDATTNMQSSGKFLEFWVPIQLSNVQLEQYCATLLSNAMALQSCSKSAHDGVLPDILTSNRKCCNHPYLVDADLQGKITQDLELTMILDVDIKASGKLHFLDLILPEVKKRQLRVLILFQPTSGSASVGPVLVEFVHQRFGEEAYEWLDGVVINPSKKQATLSNFNKEKSKFIFFLGSNACHSSIKLTSIDIVILFDSDLNPSTDIKSLQKISLDSQSEQIKIFRLYSSSTLEEKIIGLAEQDSRIQNLRSKYEALLMWGASDLFKKLTEFHSQSVVNITSEELFFSDVVEEFIHIITDRCENKDMTKSIITRVKNCGTYGKSITFHSETKPHEPDGEQPREFWKRVLEGQNPVWKFISESTQRQRKRPNFFGDSCGVKTRRKTVNTIIEPAASKPVIGETGGINEGGTKVPAHIGSRPSSGDQFWSTAAGNEVSLHDHLKPTVSKLCKFLKFSEDVTIIVETFLKYVLENFAIPKDHSSALQALMISLCWIGSSMSKYMIDRIDREEAFALAKKHLNFICSKEEADQVYEKLKPAKEMFLQNTKNLEILNASKECTTPHQEPKLSNSPLNPHESRPENHDSSNEETLQSNKEIQKGENEIDKFNRAWDEKKLNLVKDRELEMSVIQFIFRNSLSAKSEKLSLLNKEFADKLKEYQRLRVVHFNDLMATLEATEGHVAVNDELPLNGPTHETQIVDLVESDKGDQESPEAPPASFENPVEAQSHDEPVHDMCPALVVPAGIVLLSEDSAGVESTGSHSSEKQMADATVLIKPVRDIPEKHSDRENDVAVDDATVSSEPIGVTTVLSEPVGEIPAKQDPDMENDVAGQAECVEMEVSEVEFNQEHAKGGGTSSPKGPRIDSDMPAVNDMAPNVESANGLHAVEDPVGTGPEIVAPNVESAELGIRASNDMVSNVDSVDGSLPIENPNETDRNDIVLHVDSAELEMPAGNDTLPHVDSAGGSHAVNDGNETGHIDMAPHVISNEMRMPTGNDTTPHADINQENARGGGTSRPKGPNVDLAMPAVNDGEPDVDTADGSHDVEDPDGSGLEDVAPHVKLAEVEIRASNDMASNIASADRSHSFGDPNKTDPNDIVSHVDSAGDDMATNVESDDVLHAVEVPNETVPNDMAPNVESADGSHAVEDANVTGPNNAMPHVESAELGIPSGNCNQENAHDTPPSEQLVASPDHSMPAILEVQNEPLLPEQLPDIGIQDQEGQANSNPVIEVGDDNLQPIDADARQVERILPEDSSLDQHDEPSLILSTDLVITETQPANPTASEVLVQTTSAEPLAPPITAQTQLQNSSQLQQNLIDLRNAYFNQVGSRMNNHADPLQLELHRLFTVKEKMAKSHHENKQKINADCEKEIAEVIAQIKLKYENKHKEADVAYNSQNNEIDNNMNKVAMNKVLADAFRSKCQDVTPGHAGLQQASQAVLMQQLHRFAGPPAMRRLPGQSSRVQQTPLPPISAPPPPPLATSLPPSLPPRAQPPLQIVDQPSDLFCTPLTRHNTNLRPVPATPIRATPNPIIPSITTTTTTPATIRSQPDVNPIAPTTTTTTTRPPSPIINPITPSTTTTTTRPPSPNINPVTPSTTTTSRAPPTVTPITSATTPSTIRLPRDRNHLTPSTIPIRSTFRSNSFDMSAANLRISTETRGPSVHSRPLVNGVTRGTDTHMRPLVRVEARTPVPHMRPLASSGVRSVAPHMRPFVSTNVRSPAPHMRPFASTDVRSPAPHMRPFRPTSASGPPDFGNHQRTLPGQAVTTSLPLTSSSNSQPLPPLPPESSPVTPQTPWRSESPQPPPPSHLPRHTAAKSSHSSLQRVSSMPTSGSPHDSLNDNLNVLDNATRRLLLSIPELLAGGSAQPSSANEVVCLSDDD